MTKQSRSEFRASACIRAMLMLMLMLILMLTAGTAWAFDPPRVIGELRGIGEDSLEFADGFCWAGDQNGDGYDDLLVIHDNFYNYPGEERHSVNAVKLYYGGRQIDNIPDIVFQFDSDFEEIDQISYLGRLTEDNDKWFIIGSIVYEERDRIARKLYFYKGGRELDTIPDIVWTQPIDSLYELTYQSELSRPSDFNNDGFDDFLCALTSYSGDPEGGGAFLVFYGGGEFDDIPDWIEWREGYRRREVHSPLSFGADVNNDGFTDFFRGTSLYLGGDPMDTVAVWTYENIEGDTAEGDTTNRNLFSFIMFPDVNGDGFDDWGCYWTELGIRSDNDGYYLFYGSRNPDMIPDVDLTGSRRQWDEDGSIFGGNINGDSFGDIITSNPAGYADEEPWGEMDIFIGSRWRAQEAEISIRTGREYGTSFSLIGASGDYNGDNVGDFVGWSTQLVGALQFRKLLIFAGSRDWIVSTPQDSTPQPHSYHWSMITSPNPFNSRVTITVNIPASGELCVEVFDTQGRLVTNLEHPPLIPPASGRGKYTFDWLAPSAGVYLVAVTSDRGERIVVKAVCLK